MASLTTIPSATDHIAARAASIRRQSARVQLSYR